MGRIVKCGEGAPSSGKTEEINLIIHILKHFIHFEHLFHHLQSNKQKNAFFLIQAEFNLNGDCLLGRFYQPY